MPITLGLSCFYHDAAAALVRDGEVIAAAQEERFSRKKGDPAFPSSAINYCLEEAGISVNQLDSVVFYDKPGLTFDRIVASFLAVAPRGVQAWLRAMPRWLDGKLRTQMIIQRAMQESGLYYSGPVFSRRTISRMPVPRSSRLPSSVPPSSPSTGLESGRPPPLAAATARR